MTVNPSNIYLNGLMLDPNSGKIGGTRNIFSNGVMEAKIYLAWHYIADEGDTNTIRDINNWLISNGITHACNTSREDAGELLGWSCYSNIDNTSINGDRYVFDTQVVVPDFGSVDDSQPPGDTLHYLACFYLPPKGLSGGTSIYWFSPSYPFLSTLTDTLLSINCNTWAFTKDNFELKKIKISETSKYLAEFNYIYNSQIIDFYQIYNIVGWSTDKDAISPRTNLEVDESDQYSVYENYGKAFQFGTKPWFVISSYQGPMEKYSLTLAIDRSAIGYSFYIVGQTLNIEDQKVPYRDSSYTGVYDLAYSLELRNMQTVTDEDLVGFNGSALLMWQPGNMDLMDYFGNDLRYADNCYVYNKEYASDRYIIKMKCVDSFGQKMIVSLDLGGDTDCYPDSWAQVPWDLEPL